MDWFNNVDLMLGIFGGTIAIITPLWLGARLLIKNQNKLTELVRQVQTIQQGKRTLRNGFSPHSLPNSTISYDQLREVSADLAKTIEVDYYSISIGTPPQNATHLRIIFSNDPNHPSVLGKEFPCDSGISGWVFKNQISYWAANLGKDPRHYRKIDEATNTQFDNTSALVVPIPLRGRGECRGVIMFFRTDGAPFSEVDVRIAERGIPKLMKIIWDLDDHQEQDLPLVARGNLRETSLLFTDIKAFSNVIECMRTETAVSLLNEYYSGMLSIALEFGGELLEYTGDGMYINFPMESKGNAAQASFKTALKMDSEYKSLLKSWMKFGHPVSEKNVHGIGISTGSVYSGILGHSKARRKKLVGPTVNLSAHLCDFIKNKGGGILLCEDTFDLINPDNIRLTKISTPFGSAYHGVSKMAVGQKSGEKLSRGSQFLSPLYKPKPFKTWVRLGTHLKRPPP